MSSWRWWSLVGAATLIAAPPAAWAELSSLEVTPRAIELVPPGTVVADRGPPEWSHLILKTHPRVGAGDMKSISASNLRMASLLSTVFLAHVEAHDTPNGREHGIRRVAVGCTTKIKGEDVVVSPDTQERLGANFDFLERMLLKEFYRGQSQVRVVVRSPQMALVDTPVVVRHDDENRAMVIRYALLVDAQGGNLNTVLWLLDGSQRGRDHRAVDHAMQWLPPNKVEASILHVDANEYTLGIPSKRAFAITRIPSGKPLPEIRSDDWPLLCRKTYVRESAIQAEQLLTRLLAAESSSDRTARARGRVSKSPGKE